MQGKVAAALGDLKIGCTNSLHQLNVVNEIEVHRQSLAEA
jgi:hypothetical protein